MIYRVSPHVLADVRSCAMYGLVRHTLGYTSPGSHIKAAAGSAFHAGMAVYLDPKIPEEGVERRKRALAALTAKYAQVWDSAPAEQLDDAYAPLNLHRMFDRWMEMNPPSTMQWRRVIEVETAFVSRRWAIIGSAYEFTLQEINTEGLPKYIRDGYDIVELIVRPDAVVEDNQGLLRYVDTKTTGWRVKDASWLRSLKLSFQTQLYADAVVQRFGDKAVYAGWINAIEVKKIPGSSSAPTRFKKDGTPYAEALCPIHKKLKSECGLEHLESTLLDCTTDPASVRWAVDLAKKAAHTFVLLQRQHREYAPREGADDKIASLAHEGWNTYPTANIPVDGIATDKCRFCPAAQWCDAGRVLRAIPSFNMILDPWPVETGQREHAA